MLTQQATLALAKTVQEVLQRRGYRVVATRGSDATVGLDDRASAANAAKADLFLSIHCNASRAATAHGTEVYYLSLDASDRAAALLAESENAAPIATPNTAAKNAAVRYLDLILWDVGVILGRRPETGPAVLPLLVDDRHLQRLAHRRQN